MELNFVRSLRDSRERRIAINYLRILEFEDHKRLQPYSRVRAEINGINSMIIFDGLLGPASISVPYTTPIVYSNLPPNKPGTVILWQLANENVLAKLHGLVGDDNFQYTSKNTRSIIQDHVLEMFLQSSSRLVRVDDRSGHDFPSRRLFDYLSGQSTSTRTAIDGKPTSEFDLLINGSQLYRDSTLSGGLEDVTFTRGVAQIECLSFYNKMAHAVKLGAFQNLAFRTAESEFPGKTWTEAKFLTR